MKKFFGVLYIIMSSVAFGIMPIFAKKLSALGMNTYGILFYRFFFSWIILILLVLLFKQKITINKKALFQIIIVTIVGYSLTSFCLFLSYNYIPVGMATSLHFTYPAMVTLCSIAFFHEKVKGRKVAALIFSIVGVFLIMGKEAMGVNIKGIVLAVVSAAFYSTYILSVSKGDLKEINSYTLTLYVSLISSIFMMLVGFSKGVNVTYITLKEIPFALLISFISTVFALVTFVKGVKIVGPSNASILSTFEPIVSIILGVVILNEKLTLETIAGSVLILISVVLLSSNIDVRNENDSYY